MASSMVGSDNVDSINIKENEAYGVISHSKRNINIVMESNVAYRVIPQQSLNNGGYSMDMDTLYVHANVAYKSVRISQTDMDMLDMHPNIAYKAVGISKKVSTLKW